MEPLRPSDPRQIGPYGLTQRLGAGGMGEVFLGSSRAGRLVVVKLVRPELAGDPDFRRRFAQEVATARTVGGFYTAQVVDADTTAARPWVATAYIPGPTLEEAIDQRGPLPEGDVRIVGAGLAEGLTAIHACGIVHRDLTPRNVILAPDGPRVIDFGIARALDAAAGEGLTGTGVVLGSLGWMSPEQVFGQHLTAASDVFCLGAVVAYAATGRMAFGDSGSGPQAVMFRIAHHEPDLSGMTGPLRELAAQCLAKEGARRPTVEQLLARTEALLAASGAADEPWLPAPVLARLGRHAVRLLDAEAPTAMAAPPTAPNVAVPTSYRLGAPDPAAMPTAPATPPTLAAAPPSRRRAPLVAAAVTVALLAAGGVGFAMLSGGGGAAATPKAVGGSATPTRATPSQSGQSSTVPAGYLGAWDGDGRHLVISQGALGDVVVDSTALVGQSECAGQARLVSADATGMTVDETVTKAIPSGGCAEGGSQTLRLGTDATLAWSGPDGRAATLRKAGSEQIPQEFLGTWKLTLKTGFWQTITIRQGAVGTPAVTFVADGTGKRCVAEADLLSVGRTLQVGPTVVDAAASAKGCAPGGPSSLTVSGQELHREFPGPPPAMRTYGRAPSS
jgi:eukaryotic-like serine/threonine-protein kinase